MKKTGETHTKRVERWKARLRKNPRAKPAQKATTPAQLRNSKAELRACDEARIALGLATPAQVQRENTAVHVDPITARRVIRYESYEPVPTVAERRQAVRLLSRISIGDLLSLFANGGGREELLEAYPYLDSKDVRACAQYTTQRLLASLLQPWADIAARRAELEKTPMLAESGAELLHGTVLIDAMPAFIRASKREGMSREALAKAFCANLDRVYGKGTSDALQILDRITGNDPSCGG